MRDQADQYRARPKDKEALTAAQSRNSLPFAVADDSGPDMSGNWARGVLNGLADQDDEQYAAVFEGEEDES